MSTEFKVGDRVILTSPGRWIHPYCQFAKEKRVATVEFIDKDNRFFHGEFAHIRFDYRGKPDKRGRDMAVRFSDLRHAEEDSP